MTFRPPGASVSAAAACAVLLLMAARPAAAQERCGEGVDAGGLQLAAVAGAVRYDLVGGRASDGVEAGLEAGARLPLLTIRGDVQRVFLRDARADPTTARVRLMREVVRIAGIDICGVLMGGAAVAASGEDEAVTVGGGVGVMAGMRFQAGAVAFAPFVGGRALAARTTGEVLGQSLTAGGGSLGLEAGVGAALGRARAALRFSMDGFDAALGATPYPAFALRLSAGWRF